MRMSCRHLPSTGRRLCLTSLIIDLAIALAAPMAGARQVSSEPEIEPWLSPGTEVVLKDPNTPIRDREWLALSGDHLIFLIESVQGERLLVASRDKTQGGWLRRDQVLDLESAVNYFTREIERIPHHADAYWMRGRVWAYRAEDERALADFDRAIQLGPDQAPYHVRRAVILIRTRQFDKALADCDKAIALDPKRRGGLRAPVEHPALTRRDASVPRPTSTRPFASTPSIHRLAPSSPPPIETPARSKPVQPGCASFWL